MQLSLQRIGPRHRRVHHADPRRGRGAIDQRRRSWETTDHGRRRQARLGQAHHGDLSLLRLRPPRPQGVGPRARSPPNCSPTCSKPPAPSAWCSVDLHSGQIQGFFNGPVDHLTAMPVILDTPCRVRRRHRDGLARHRSGEGGREVRASAALPTSRSSTRLGAKIEKNVVEAKEVIGDVKGRTCVLIDDMIDTGGTIVAAAELLAERGAERVIAACTHGVFSGPAIDRIKNSVIEQVVSHQHASARAREADRQDRATLGRADHRARDRRGVPTTRA